MLIHNACNKESFPPCQPPSSAVPFSHPKKPCSWTPTVSPKWESAKLRIRKSGWFHPLLLLGWIAVGAVLRFVGLNVQACWGDEFSTLVFGLGNSFQTVPLDRAIPLDTLLSPLQLRPDAGLGSVVRHLLDESTHPPVYFALTHLWMRLFSPDNGVAVMTVGRSLAALCGIAAIPATFGLGWLAFGSYRVAHLAAALMAVSPLGVFLSREARHYPLAILLFIASMACLVVAIRRLRQGQPPTVGLVLGWIVINALGIATHYFFGLAFAAEGIALLRFWIADWKQGEIWGKPWRRIYAAIAGTLASGLAWIPVWQSFYGSDLTSWVYEDEPLEEWFEPIERTIGWMVSMLFQLPTDTAVVSETVEIISQIAVGIAAIAAAIAIFRGLKRQPSAWLLEIRIFGGIILGAIAIFLVFYIFGTDLTLAPRFSFIYFPAFIAFVAVSLHAQPKAAIAIWLLGLLGGMTVVANIGDLEHHRPDRLVDAMQRDSQAPILISTTHDLHHGPIVKMMGIAVELMRENMISPQFLLAHHGRDLGEATGTLGRILMTRDRPLDLWLVNFKAPIDLTGQNCRELSDGEEEVGRFEYRHYRCDRVRNDWTAES